MPRTIGPTCYLIERNGTWEALCTDYDIAVQGKSANDTRHKLGRAVRTYLADVMDHGTEHREQPIGRSAPLKVRAVLALRAAWPNRLQRGSVWSIVV